MLVSVRSTSVVVALETESVVVVVSELPAVVGVVVTGTLLVTVLDS